VKATSKLHSNALKGVIERCPYGILKNDLDFQKNHTPKNIYNQFSLILIYIYWTLIEIVMNFEVGNGGCSKSPSP